jgi:RNA 3'-terminal phosphate cyclase
MGLKPLRLPGSIPTTPTKNSSTSSTPPLGPDEGATHFFAFKAIRRDAIKVSSGTGTSQIIESRGTDGEDGEKRKSAKDVVRSIVEKLKEEGEKVGTVDENWIKEKDIIRYVSISSSWELN